MYSIFISNIDSKSQWSKVQTNKQLKKIANSTFHHKNMDIFLFTWIFYPISLSFNRNNQLCCYFSIHQEVVRKGYEYPEIAAKMISVMFDKIRFGCTDSEEFDNYYQLNVESTLIDNGLAVEIGRAHV